MRLLRRIVRLGVTGELTYQSKREIVTTNYISLILTGALVSLLVIRFFLFDDATYRVYWALGFAVFVTPLILNGLLLTTLSRLFLSIGPVCFLWFSFMSAMLTMDVLEQSMFDGLRIFLLAVSFFPYLILDRSKPFLLILGILPTLISFLFFTPIVSLFGIPLEQTSLHTRDFQLMEVRSFIAYFVLSAGCFAFRSIISINDRFNQRLLNELKNKASEIESQNGELLQKQDELNALNQQLEELVDIKTRNIKRQNEILIKYSYTNAHKVRGPVARILGLIQVSRLKTDLNFPWFFEKVEEETKGIDEIISKISRELGTVEQDEKENE